MFVRKKLNPSGIISVQVIDKSSGKYVVARSIGSSSNDSEIELLVKQAKEWIDAKNGSLELDFDGEVDFTRRVLEGTQSLRLVGIELTLGKIFNEIGFGIIEDPIFKHLVLYRLVYPKSKLKTTEYLERYAHLNLRVDQVYRYMDKLYHSQKSLIEKISFDHTLKVLGGRIGLVFYDVTTVYFEIEQEDELRKSGFSKDGKHQHPQIVLGLLTGPNGYPLAYDIFEGNKFEGHTILPVIDSFKKKFNLVNPIIVADSGLLSKANIDTLQASGYEYILGARIKNESPVIKQEVLSLGLVNGQSRTITKGDQRLIITFSNKRAKKDCN